MNEKMGLGIYWKPLYSLILHGMPPMPTTKLIIQIASRNIHMDDKKREDNVGLPYNMHACMVHKLYELI